MEERPIIFSTESVIAILEGRKTQTRRVMKKIDPFAKCPYGLIGDRLWVREKWRIVGFGEDPFVIEYADGVALEEPGVSFAYDFDENQYVRLTEQSCDDCQKAGIMPDHDGYYYFEDGIVPTRWRSPIHMPRWASRITLEITDIRVDRLMSMSQNDAKEEGVKPNTIQVGMACGTPEDYEDYKQSFADLWDSLNAKRGYPWSSNPLVWVIEFKRLERER